MESIGIVANPIALEQYEGMVKNRAYHYSKKYRVEFSEVLQEGFLVFCNAVKKYDPSRGNKFSTYLWNQLQILHDWCETEQKWNVFKTTKRTLVIDKKMSFKNVHMKTDFEKIYTDLSETEKAVFDDLKINSYHQIRMRMKDKHNMTPYYMQKAIKGIKKKFIQAGYTP